jgi:protein CsiD
MKNIPGLEITENSSSKRILDIKIKEEIISELIDLFKRFDLTAIEYKPFTRFTVAKYLDDLTNNELSKYLNDILRDRKTGCFIIGPEKLLMKLMIFFW